MKNETRKGIVDALTNVINLLSQNEDSVNTSENTEVKNNPHINPETGMPKELPIPGRVEVMDCTHITNAQYKSLVPEHTFSTGKEHHPVVNVNWWDAARFCNLRSERAGLKVYYVRLDEGNDVVHVDLNSNGYRLPDEWLYERAALAGSAGPFCCPESELTDYAHFNASDTIPVASKKPNAWGFYDLHGLAWHWMENLWGKLNG